MYRLFVIINLNSWISLFDGLVVSTMPEFFLTLKSIKCYEIKPSPAAQRCIVEGEVPAPVVILCDLAYPLLPFLMKEYAGGSNTIFEQFFGYRLCSARMVIECAFGRLNGRFGCLRRPKDINLCSSRLL